MLLLHFGTFSGRQAVLELQELIPEPVGMFNVAAGIEMMRRILEQKLFYAASVVLARTAPYPVWTNM